MFRAIPTLSPWSATIGMLSESSISSFEIFSTVPTLIVVFTESIKSSFDFIDSVFFESVVPKTSSNNFVWIFTLFVISGSSPFFDAMQPVKESVFVKKGSSEVSIDIDAPGRISFTDSFPLWSERIFVVMVWYSVWLCFFTISPGLISISSSIFNFPDFRIPPKTPPFNFSIFVPGLLMSKLRAIKKIGYAFSSFFGISILQISSKSLSIFTPCWAEIGIIGEFSAIVPFTNSLIIL